jgi:hypothetical protein
MIASTTRYDSEAKTCLILDDWLQATSQFGVIVAAATCQAGTSLKVVVIIFIMK